MWFRTVTRRDVMSVGPNRMSETVVLNRSRVDVQIKEKRDQVLNQEKEDYYHVSVSVKWDPTRLDGLKEQVLPEKTLAHPLVETIIRKANWTSDAQRTCLSSRHEQ